MHFQSEADFSRLGSHASTHSSLKSRSFLSKTLLQFNFILQPSGKIELCSQLASHGSSRIFSSLTTNLSRGGNALAKPLRKFGSSWLQFSSMVIDDWPKRVKRMDLWEEQIFLNHEGKVNRGSSLQIDVELIPWQKQPIIYLLSSWSFWRLICQSKVGLKTCSCRDCCHYATFPLTLLHL